MTKLEKHIYQSSQRVILKTQVTSIQNPVHEIIWVMSFEQSWIPQSCSISLELLDAVLKCN